ncbi:MAG TPA: hypothetical protein VF543_22580 [Pyrinomonadaceae bacterium]|jgi:hypothetical protein
MKTLPKTGERWLVRIPSMIGRREVFEAEVVSESAQGWQIRPVGREAWPIWFGLDWFIERV